MRQQLQVKTSQSIELKEITREINQAIAGADIREGACLVFCPHTTAAITINEHADPDVRLDLQKAFEKLVPSVPFAHVEGNSPAHFLSSVVGPSVLIPIREGRLQLGTWQGVFFCEFDGPRTRQVWLQVS
ncbi:MAG: YjbQ family protein [Acidobacteria bacterium]|nr:MAG: YjbQ family protein [Acidobacteriota bacterium]